jgi:hypothetical protein
MLLAGCANCHWTFDIDGEDEEVAPVVGIKCDF